MVNRSVLVLSASLAAASAAGVLRRREPGESDLVRSHLEGRRRRAESEAYDPYLGTTAGRRGLEEEDAMSMPAGGRCTFCPDGVNDPSVVLPGSPDEKVTCGQVKAFAETLASDDALCGTAVMGELLCCPVGPWEGDDEEEVVEEEEGAEEEECSSIYEIASSNAEFSTLASAVNAAGLGAALKMPGSLTVFAPLNSAFENIFTPELAAKYLDPVWKPQLQDLLLYHALASEVYSDDLVDGLEAPTVNFSEESVVINLGPPRVNENSIIELPDVEACNGVVHGVSEVLLPASVTSDIVDIGMVSEDFSTLVAAVDAAGLVDTLKGEGPFTLFAPTNDAFAALPEGTVEALLLPENLDTLVSILTYHVVPANALITSIETGAVTTVNGAAVDVEVSDDGITVNDSSVIQANVIASNGIIHVIDAVLLPPEEPEASQTTTESPPITFTTEEPEVEMTTESPTTEAPVTEVPVTEAPVTEAPEDDHEVEPVPPPPATTEAPWSGADAMLAKSKSGKAKCGKSKKEGGDNEDGCAEGAKTVKQQMGKVTKEYTAGKSGKTQQAKAHYEVDAKAEKIMKSKGSKIFSKGSKKAFVSAPPAMSLMSEHTDDAWSR